MSDIFDYITMIDKYKFESKNNKIEIQTFTDNDSFNFIINNKFDSNKLSIIINEHFEIIPNTIPCMNKSILPKNNTTKIKYIKNLNKKRGRHIKDNIIKGRKKPHDRTCPCNIRTRITIAYLSFIPKFINSVSELLLCEEDGIDINQYKLKNIKHCKNITLALIKKLKNKKIKDIVSFRINSKNIFGEKTENEEICQNIIKKSKKIENILNQNYLEFFENIFCQKNREISLTKYGINKNLFLNSDVILYKDFINNIKSKENNGDNLEQYLKLIEEGVKNYFKI